MNKYVLGTSLFWLCILALLAGFLYRPPAVKKDIPLPSGPQPVTAGPAPSIGNPPPQPVVNREVALAPVQLTPEGMQNIGVKTGMVERRSISDDIRATGTVDINERLVSYVQVRFRGYIRKVFASATYQYVRQGEPLFTIYSPDLVATEQDYLNALEDEKHCGGVPRPIRPPSQVAEADTLRVQVGALARFDLVL